MWEDDEFEGFDDFDSSGQSVDKGRYDDESDPSSILNALGIYEDADILITSEFAVGCGLGIRGQRFSTLIEAVLFLLDIGVLGFSFVVQFPDGTYGVSIPNDSGRPAKRKR